MSDELSRQHMPDDAAAKGVPYEDGRVPVPGTDRWLDYRHYGTVGVPVLVFPTELGSCEQWDVFGMFEPYAKAIRDGMVTFWCVDGIDAELFFGRNELKERIDGLAAYEDAIRDQLMPLIRDASPGPLVLAGAAFGGTQAVLLATRRPGDGIRRVVALASRYDVSRWLFGQRSDSAYFWDPLAFLPGLQQAQYVDPLRGVRFDLVTEESIPNAEEARLLVDLLRSKDVDARIEIASGPFVSWEQWRAEFQRLLPPDGQTR